MKISVVIPAYNAERYLEEALHSVINQTIKPYEILVVNDGSTDGTQKILDKYKPICRTVEFTKNRGIGFARHIGAEEAKGDYVAFLSADDVYFTQFIKIMSQNLSPEKISFSDYIQCDENLKPIGIFCAPKTENNREFKREAIKWALKQNLFVNFSTVVIPKKIFEKVQFDRTLRFGEDLQFLLESLTKGVSWSHFSLPLLYYRIHIGAGTFHGWTHKNWSNLWKQITPLLLELNVSKKEIDTAIQKNYWRRYHPLSKTTRYVSTNFPELWSAAKRNKLFKIGRKVLRGE